MEWERGLIAASATHFFERISEVASTAQLGEEPAQVALAWLLANPVVTAPIIGPRTPQQLDETLRALEISMPPEALKKLDEIFLGPGGPAPEAYAW
jgi:aryl-alcohol dehydrogenase-like predicted oxidoreductase